MDIEYNFEGQAYEHGYDIAKKNGTAIVGMSPGNSYFKKETIDELLQECTKNFSKIIVMIPNKPAVHTYKALGYTDSEAERKARLKSNALCNSTKEIISKLKETYSGEIAIAKWDSPVAKSQDYQRESEKILQLYENNGQFKKDVRNTTKKVIENKMKPGLDLEKSLDEGVKYLLSELTFVSAYSKFYNTDVAYVYHNPWPIYENYVNGIYDGERQNLGFVLIK